MCRSSTRSPGTRPSTHWDRALHFGYRPWELLQPVLGYWPITFLINLNYNMWFVVMNVFWAYYAFIANPSAERTRFFLSFVLIWMLGGGVLAVFFSSAGPCYFTELGISPDPYAPLMAYLNEANEHAPIWALMTQNMLWDLHAEGSAFGGVSAMPSMHNATALLFVLASAGQAALGAGHPRGSLRVDLHRLGASGLALCGRWLCCRWHWRWVCGGLLAPWRAGGKQRAPFKTIVQRSRRESLTWPISTALSPSRRFKHPVALRPQLPGAMVLLRHPRRSIFSATG